ncbi:MAG: DUF58 domain-containing protein [Spirochaetaceae bacterium]
MVLVLVCLYSYTATFLLETMQRRRDRSVTAAVTEHPRGVGEEASLALDLPAAASPLPAIQARWRVEFRFHDRVISLERPALGEGRRSWRFTPPRRGLYEASGVALRFGDRFGFARTEVRYPDRLELPVPPKPGGGPGRRPTSAGRADRSRRGRSLRRNELLIESRPYHPGDDLRRLNWKALARTDELLVRIGEEMPPARRQVALICDPGHCSDQVAEEASFLLQELQAQGYRCRLVNGSTGEECDEKEAEHFLSSLWDSFEPPASEVEISRYSAAILLSPRGATARRDTRVASALSRGTLTLQEVACTVSRGEERALLERLLFVPRYRT